MVRVWGWCGVVWGIRLLGVWCLEHDHQDDDHHHNSCSFLRSSVTRTGQEVILVTRIGCVWDEILVTVGGFGAAVWDKCARTVTGIQHVWTRACRGGWIPGAGGGGGGRGTENRTIHIYIYIYVHVDVDVDVNVDEYVYVYVYVYVCM